MSLQKHMGLLTHWGGGNWSGAVFNINLKTTTYVVPKPGMLIVQYSVPNARTTLTNGRVFINDKQVGLFGLGNSDLNGQFHTVATYPVNTDDECRATTENANTTVIATFVPTE